MKVHLAVLVALTDIDDMPEGRDHIDVDAAALEEIYPS